MADNLSPLVNLDLVNQIYRTINAQINERVYDPLYNSKATLGSTDHRYVNAYLGALDVSGRVAAKELNSSLVAIGNADNITFARYATKDSSTPAATTTYTLASTLNDDGAEIPTSKAVYTVIGNLEELLENI